MHAAAAVEALREKGKRRGVGGERRWVKTG
jgi:hypothetical protein